MESVYRLCKSKQDMANNGIFPLFSFTTGANAFSLALALFIFFSEAVDSSPAVAMKMKVPLTPSV